MARSIAAWRPRHDRGRRAGGAVSSSEPAPGEIDAAMMRRGASRLALLSLALALAAAACSKSTKPKPADAPPPTPTTPANALLLLGWSWDHRDTLHYDMLPTADFWFGWTISGDSVTNPLGNLPWTRDAELHFAGHLFVGGAHLGDPPASSVAFSFISAPIPTADSRPG